MVLQPSCPLTHDAPALRHMPTSSTSVLLRARRLPQLTWSRTLVPSLPQPHLQQNLLVRLARRRKERTALVPAHAPVVLGIVHRGYTTGNEQERLRGAGGSQQVLGFGDIVEFVLGTC